MSDLRKFRLLIGFAAVLCVLTIAYNIAEELILPDIQSHLQRKLYYEKVISKKGLSLHNALYWKPEK